MKHLTKSDLEILKSEICKHHNLNLNYDSVPTVHEFKNDLLKKYPYNVAYPDKYGKYLELYWKLDQVIKEMEDEDSGFYHKVIVTEE